MGLCVSICRQQEVTYQNIPPTPLSLPGLPESVHCSFATKLSQSIALLLPALIYCGAILQRTQHVQHPAPDIAVSGDVLTTAAAAAAPTPAASPAVAAVPAGDSHSGSVVNAADPGSGDRECASCPAMATADHGSTSAADIDVTIKQHSHPTDAVSPERAVLEANGMGLTSSQAPPGLSALQQRSYSLMPHALYAICSSEEALPACLGRGGGDKGMPHDVFVSGPPLPPNERGRADTARALKLASAVACPEIDILLEVVKNVRDCVPDSITHTDALSAHAPSPHTHAHPFQHSHAHLCRYRTLVALLCFL